MVISLCIINRYISYIYILVGYFELVQVLLAMNANVEDRGSKGDCTPLMEAASGGFGDIVRLLLQNHANINAQSSSGEFY